MKLANWYLHWLHAAETDITLILFRKNISFMLVDMLNLTIIISGGNSIGSKCVIKLQKPAIRIIMGAKNNDSCREFFKLLKILPLSAQ